MRSLASLDTGRISQQAKNASNVTVLPKPQEANDERTRA